MRIFLSPLAVELRNIEQNTEGEEEELAHDPYAIVCRRLTAFSPANRVTTSSSRSSF